MSSSLKILPTNQLANSVHYSRILKEYNDRLESDGKVNNKKFWEDVISPLVPGYSMRMWYFFLKRMEAKGLTPAAAIVDQAPIVNADEQQDKTVKNLLSNQAATIALIQGILNISADAAKEIIEHPEKLTTKERLEIGLKAMKAQDSRIHAVGKLREDNREQEKFERAFDDANY